MNEHIQAFYGRLLNVYNPLTSAGPIRSIQVALKAFLSVISTGVA